MGDWEAVPPVVDDTVGEIRLFCHSFKNDIAIFAFNAYKVFNMKWKKNQFGGKKC